MCMVDFGEDIREEPGSCFDFEVAMEVWAIVREYRVGYRRGEMVADDGCGSFVGDEDLKSAELDARVYRVRTGPGAFGVPEFVRACGIVGSVVEFV